MLTAFIERTAADELIITSQIFEHARRVASYEIVAAVHAAMAAERHGTEAAALVGGHAADVP